MSDRNCNKIGSGCGKSRNTFHKCKKLIKLTTAQDKKIVQGGRIDGALFTDYCKGHACQFCHRKF